MKKIIILVMAIIMMLSMVGCTAQERAKHLGGQYTMELDRGQALEMVTWKDDTLWVLTVDMEEDYEPKDYIFQADSSYGVFEGTVYIKESK